MDNAEMNIPEAPAEEKNLISANGGADNIQGGDSL